MGSEEKDYDYRKISVKRSMISLYTEAYKCFGWILIYMDGKEQKLTSDSKITLEFKRGSKIRNKGELTRLQRSFDACANEICEMEESKTDTASKASFGASVVGSVFMCCSVLLSVASQAAECILMVIPGILGWLSSGFLYNAVVKKKTEEVDPLIEQKYDEIHHVCQKASGLTDCE